MNALHRRPGGFWLPLFFASEFPVSILPDTANALARSPSADDEAACTGTDGRSARFHRQKYPARTFARFAPSLARAAALVLVLAASSGTRAAELTFAEDFTDFPNPERGWFRSLDPSYPNNGPVAPLSPGLLAWWRTSENITLVRKYYLIRAYRDTDLPQSVLDEVAADLVACRTAGVKLIPRFVYNWNLGYGDEDATLSRTLGHVAQLGAVFRANPGPVDHFQAGFIGRWGEMHSSTNGHVLPGTTTLAESGKTIVETLINEFPASRMVGLRYPDFKKSLFPAPLTTADAYTQTKRARLGVYDDGFLYSATDYGTYSTDPAEREAQRAYWAADTAWTFTSGEPAGMTAYSAQDPRPELARFQWTSLNGDQYDAESEGFYAYWRDHGYWDEVTRRLGYRFYLASASLPVAAALGERVSLSLSLTNRGFAPLHNPRLLRVVLRRSGGGAADAVFDFPAIDPRFWRPGERTDLTLPVDLPADLATGTWEVLLGLLDPEMPALPAFSLRLASQNVWENATGLNRLATLQVTATALQAWRANAFGSPDATGSAADSADPDGDGLPNLIEYALDTSPTAPSAAPAASLSSAAPSALQLTFLRARAELSYAVEASSDLSTWTTLAANPGAVSATTPVTVTDNVDLAAGAPARRFLRLRVSP